MSRALKSQDKVTTVISRIEEADEPLFLARGCVWKKVGQEGAFWRCDLVKEGTSFADRPQRVWLLPALEDIQPLEEGLFRKPGPEAVEMPAKSSRNAERWLRENLAGDPLQAEDPKDLFLRSASRVRANASVQFREWQYLPLLRALELPFPRLLIADDVGLGKTTEAGLILQHLAGLGRAERILIISPAHLCEKWADEMRHRFGLEFEIFDRDVRHRLARKGVRNPWAAAERIIVSMDFAKRFENLKPLSRVDFDCVVVDEAHHYMVGDRSPTNRLRELAERICLRAPALFLLSATPFRGGEKEFTSLLQLLDPLAGEQDSDGDPTPGAKELWKKLVVRRTKADLPDARDFPKRSVKDVRCAPASAAEQAAISALKDFLGEVLNNAESQAPHLLAEIYQKRASSSWVALKETLSRTEPSTAGSETREPARAALSLALEALLAKPQAQAKMVAFTELMRSLLNQNERVVVFTEYVATLQELAVLLAREFPKLSFGCITGNECWARVDGVELKDGSVRRHHVEEHFSKAEGRIAVLLCTDTCSEGIDLQGQCHNLIHFEMPWSLVKLEQRNGRIDRFGQTKPPRIHNLVFDSDATKDQVILARISERVEELRERLGSVSALIEDTEGAQRDLAEILRSRPEDAPRILPEMPTHELESYRSRSGEDAESNWLSELAATACPTVWETNALIAQTVLEGEDGFLKQSPTEGVWFLHLPPEWQTPEVLGGLPPTTTKAPWHVVFHPDVARRMEAKLRQDELENGEDDEKRVHFLNSTHPVMEMLRRRQKLRLFAEGTVPTLKSTGLREQRSVLVCEASLTSNGDRGIVLARFPVLVDEEGERVPATTAQAILEQSTPIEPGDKLARNLPKDSEWNGMIARARDYAQTQAEDLLAKRKRRLQSQVELNRRVEALAEASGKSGKAAFLSQHADARRSWLNELHSPARSEADNRPLVRLQPLALVLRGGAK